MPKNIKKTVYTNDEVNVVNELTGELHNFESKSHRITIEEYLEDDDENDECSDFFMNDITFIKSFRGNGIMLNQKLTNVEIAAVVFLCDFICYEDCVLRKNGNKKSAPLSIRDLSNLIGIKYETFRKTMSSLKKKQVIGIHSTGDVVDGNSVKWITVNPYIFCRGIKVEKWVIDFYSTTEWAALERQKMKSYVANANNK